MARYIKYMGPDTELDLMVGGKVEVKTDDVIAIHPLDVQMIRRSYAAPEDFDRVWEIVQRPVDAES